MVIKAKTWKQPRFKALLNYMCKDSEKAEGKFDFILTHNVKGESPEQWAQSFATNEELRLRKRKDSVRLTHFILSFHEEDTPQLNGRTLEDLTRKFIEEHGLTGMYVAVPHKSENHLHVHICAGALKYSTGESMRMSKMEFGALKTRMQKYQLQQYPKLTHSIVAHGGKEKQSRTNLLKELHELVDTEIKKGSPQTFLEKIEEKGVKTYARGGRLYGFVFKDRKFRFDKLGLDSRMFESANRKDRLERLQKSKDERSNFNR